MNRDYTLLELIDALGYASDYSRTKTIKISKVIFNDPATIVFWSDGIKTVVKCSEHDIYDKEKGLAMAITKRVLGNNGNYYNTIKKWVSDDERKIVSFRHVINSLNKFSETIFKLAGKLSAGMIKRINVEDSDDGRYYLELLDGYRLIFNNDGYVGRYDPNMLQEEHDA